MSIVVAPAFLVGIIGWLADRLTSRTFKIAAAAFYTASVVAVLGSVFGLLSLIGAVMPAPVSQALSVLAPSDWIAQVSVVLSAKTLEMGYSVFFRAYRMAMQ
jgi:uncharacterized membrane protein